MNADPLAQLLANCWIDSIPLTSIDARHFTEQAMWLRAHRDELLAALGGTEHHGAIELPRSNSENAGLTVRYPQPGESVWVFGKDAS